MTVFFDMIFSMDSTSFYLILALSTIWSYLIAEMLGSAVVGVISMPLFSLCSFLMMHILQSNQLYLSSSKMIDVFISSSLGSIIGVAATILAIRMISTRRDSYLKSMTYKGDRRNVL